MRSSYRRTAHVYDLIYEGLGKDYQAESAEVDGLVKERNPGARSLLDVACGTGGHLRHLRRWYEVTGVDLDSAMLREARGHLPGIHLVRADMRDFCLRATFDTVTCLFSSIAYMTTKGELADAIAAMARHLGAGGVLIVDGWVRPDAWLDGRPPHLEVSSREDLKVARMGLSRREGDKTTLEMHHLIGTRDGIGYLVDRHELHLFTPAQYEDAFRSAGLAVEVLESPMPGRDRYVGTASERRGVSG